MPPYGLLELSARKADRRKDAAALRAQAHNQFVREEAAMQLLRQRDVMANRVTGSKPALPSREELWRKRLVHPLKQRFK